MVALNGGPFVAMVAGALVAGELVAMMSALLLEKVPPESCLSCSSFFTS